MGRAKFKYHNVASRNSKGVFSAKGGRVWGEFPILFYHFFVNVYIRIFRFFT
uniref:Uncharacterized protein n=1 Tax=Thermococcus sp. IRI33 TaxID=1197733 RepID=L0B8E5_9EURY|nr:hypothetical protein i33-2 [Thermococcus sp. IRI33]